MREIKFRVWDKNINRMYNTTSIAITKKNGVLMQFTGLKDKNGKKVYEDDIIECNGKGKKSRYKVKFEITEDYESKFGWGSIGWYKDEIEVIGNIYENPELLK